MADESARRASAGVVVLAPAGELDLASTPRLRELLYEAHSPGATVVLDLDDVVFLDSSALAVVLSAERRLRGSGGSLRLVNVAEEVLRVLRICGLAERLVRERPVLTAVTLR
jgi:anti-sigma B factor antagonist